MVYDEKVMEPSSTPTLQAPTYASGMIYNDFMGRWSKRLAYAFLDILPLDEGTFILDVGCGTGSLAQAIANSVNVAKIVGVDPSAKLLKHAERVNIDKRISYMEGYGQQLPCKDEQFDTVLALLALHNVPNPSDAVEEMKRVAKSGALLAACEWDFAEGMEMLTILWDTLVELDANLAPLHSKHNKLGGERDLPELWQSHGLVDVTHFTINVPLEFESFDDYFVPLMMGAATASKSIAAFKQDKKDLLIRLLKERFLGERSDGPFTLNARAFAVVGSVGRGKTDD